MSLQTEYPFTLPKGYVDDSGVLHRSGTMRLARASDGRTLQRGSGLTGAWREMEPVLRVVTFRGCCHMMRYQCEACGAEKRAR